MSQSPENELMKKLKESQFMQKFKAAVARAEKIKMVDMERAKVAWERLIKKGESSPESSSDANVERMLDYELPKVDKLLQIPYVWDDWSFWADWKSEDYSEHIKAIKEAYGLSVGSDGKPTSERLYARVTPTPPPIKARFLESTIPSGESAAASPATPTPEDDLSMQAGIQSKRRLGSTECNDADTGITGMPYVAPGLALVSIMLLLLCLVYLFVAKRICKSKRRSSYILPRYDNDPMLTPNNLKYEL